MNPKWQSKWTQIGSFLDRTLAGSQLIHPEGHLIGPTGPSSSTRLITHDTALQLTALNIPVPEWEEIRLFFFCLFALLERKKLMYTGTITVP